MKNISWFVSIRPLRGLLLLSFLLALVSQSWAQLRQIQLTYTAPDDTPKDEFYSESTTIVRKRNTPVDIIIYRDFALTDSTNYFAGGPSILNRENENDYGFQQFKGLFTSSNADGDCTVSVTHGESTENLVLSVTSPLAVDQPDLQVSNILVDGSTSVRTYYIGETVSIACSVLNVSLTDAAASELSFYLSPTLVLNPSISPFESNQVGSITAVGSSPQSTQYTFTEADSGQNYLIFDADHSDDVDEEEEENNIAVFGPFTVAVPPSPEIIVWYFDEMVDDGDRSPSATKGSDFGIVSVGSAPVSRTFTVENTGEGTLLLSEPFLPEGFAISETLDDEIPAGSFDTFTVEMLTDSEGTKSGVVSVMTNDEDEDPFDFAIQGEVSATKADSFLEMLSIMLAGSLSDTPEILYSNNIKYLAYLSGELPTSIASTVSATVYIDMADFYCSVTPGASFSEEGDNDWITVWVDVGASLGVGLTPSNFGLIPMRFEEYGDPDRTFDISLINSNLPILKTTAFSWSDSGYSWGHSDIVIQNSFNASLISLDINVARFEIKRDSIRSTFAGIFDGNGNIGSNSQAGSIATQIISQFVEYQDGRVVIKKENDFFRAFTSEDSLVNGANGEFGQIAGGFDIDNDGLRDNVFITVPEVFGNPLNNNQGTTYVPIQNTGDQNTDYYVKVKDTPHGWRVMAVDSDSVWLTWDDRFDVENVPEASGPNDYVNTRWSVVAGNSGPANAEVTFELYKRGAVFAPDTLLREVTVTFHRSLDAGNIKPAFSWDLPSENVSVQSGETIEFAWTDSDPDDDAQIYIALDEDLGGTPWDDNQHTLIASELSEDHDGSGDRYLWSTGGIPPGIYSVWAFVYDGTSEVDSDNYVKLPYHIEVLEESGGLEPPRVEVAWDSNPIMDDSIETNEYDGTRFDTGSLVRTFTIENSGEAPLILGTLSVPSGFSVYDAPKTTLQAGESDTFTIQVTATREGPIVGEVSFSNGDPDQNPFNFWISTEVEAPLTVEFEYYEINGEIVIYGVTDDLSGVLTIPPQIEGIPVGVIGSGAFNNEREMTGVVLPPSVHTIEYGAFEGCDNLEAINLAEGLISIEDRAFSICRSLRALSFPQSLVNIGLEAFQGCEGLTEVTLPAGIRTLGLTPFAGCYQLADFYVDPGNTHFSASDGILFNKDKAKVVQVPEGKEGAYTIPETVQVIGEGAFYYSQLEFIHLPLGLVEIENDGFLGCTALRNIALPSSLVEIGDSAFEYCLNLETVTIPENVSQIGKKVFSQCRRLDAIEVHPGNIFFKSVDGVLFDHSGTVLIQFPGTKSGRYAVPDGVIEVGEYAFFAQQNITSITLPSSLATIGNQAWLSCRQLGSVIFEGNAPNLGSYFNNVSSGFVIYYFDGASGFSIPTWNGHNSVALANGSELEPWLVGNGYAQETDLIAIAPGAGVPLLQLYALSSADVGSSAPPIGTLENSTGKLELTFFGGRSDLSYVVEGSRDLIEWNSVGIDVSSPDSDGMRTAVDNSGQNYQFMRIILQVLTD